jgi:hypothetical protein
MKQSDLNLESHRTLLVKLILAVADVLNPALQQFRSQSDSVIADRFRTDVEVEIQSAAVPSDAG